MLVIKDIGVGLIRLRIGIISNKPMGFISYAATYIMHDSALRYWWIVAVEYRDKFGFTYIANIKGYTRKG